MPKVNFYTQHDISVAKFLSSCSDVELMEADMILGKMLYNEAVNTKNLGESGAFYLKNVSPAGVLYALKRQKDWYFVQHQPGQKPRLLKKDPTLTAQAEAGQIRLTNSNSSEFIDALLLAIEE